MLRKGVGEKKTLEWQILVKGKIASWKLRKRKLRPKNWEGKKMSQRKRKRKGERNAADEVLESSIRKRID